MLLYTVHFMQSINFILILYFTIFKVCLLFVLLMLDAVLLMLDAVLLMLDAVLLMLDAVLLILDAVLRCCFFFKFLVYLISKCLVVPSVDHLNMNKSMNY
jgi:hypothetical protein